MPAGTAVMSSPPWMPPDRHPSPLILEYHLWKFSRQVTAELQALSLLLGLAECRSFLFAILRLTTLPGAGEKQNPPQNYPATPIDHSPPNLLLFPFSWQLDVSLSRYRGCKTPCHAKPVWTKVRRMYVHRRRSCLRLYLVASAGCGYSMAVAGFIGSRVTCAAN
jgi:hypothetical protein